MPIGSIKRPSVLETERVAARPTAQRRARRPVVDARARARARVHGVSAHPPRAPTVRRRSGRGRARGGRGPGQRARAWRDDHRRPARSRGHRGARTCARGRHRERVVVAEGAAWWSISLTATCPVHGAGSPWAFDRWSCAPCGATVDARSSMHPRQRSRPPSPASQCQPRARPCHASRGLRLARTPPGPP
jgi:hypothetical protein